ncbi:MAG TPA: sialate O-acetylesterase, partial [Tepidisphaeraceae bacterium]|nr:sialate O-acetylesterase [Tepidisphaeraceae bacterium]
VANWPTAKAEFDRKLAEWEEACNAAEAAGQTPPQRPNMPYGPESTNAPAAVWNGLVNPVVPVAMTGVIWYQGESNAGRAEQYRSLMRGLIQGWRDAWNQGDFPFIQVQLTSFRAPATQPSQPSPWAELRESQALVCRDLPNVGMVCITDVGDAQDIHPRDKQTVGYRLAQVALRDVYGQDVLASGPVFSDVQFDGARAIVSFETFGSALQVKGDALRGFLIAGEDQQWHFATATLENGRVIVTQDGVPRPVAVRYNWADNPDGNLFNTAGWPAHPFATDTWPRSTAGKR